MADLDTPRPLKDASGKHVLGSLVLDLAKNLGRLGIAYAFLRGHENLPKIRRGSDVDILLPASERSLFEELLTETCEDFGARVWQKAEAGFFTQYQLHARSADGTHHFLSVDLHSSEAVFGVPFLDSKLLMPTTADSRELCIVQPGPGALANFMGPFLSGGVVRQDYAESLKEHLAHDSGEVRSLLGTLLGAGAAARFCAQLAAGEYEALSGEARGLRFKLIGRRFLRSPLRSTWGLLSFAYGARIRPLWRPRGLFLAFLGTDGAGKTTVMEALERELAPAFRSAESGTWHLRPMVIPQLDTLLHLGRSTYSLADMDRPHRAKPSGAFLSNVRVAYYWLDYIVGFALKITPRRRRPSLILFDRYFYDYKVDPLRCRVRRGTQMVHWLSPWVPKPDKVVVISAQLERVRARKQELSVEESAFQIAAYETLGLTEPGFVLVHNNGTVEEAVNDVLDAVFGGEEQ